MKLKLWRSASAAVLLSACTPPAPAPAPEPAAPTAIGGEAGEDGGEHGGAASIYAGLSGDQLTGVRLQHLEAFVLVARRIAEGDRVVDAAALVQQGLREIYDPAPDQFGTLDAEALRAAASAGAASRGEMAGRLNAADAAIDRARAAVSVNHADLAVRMVDLSAVLYQTIPQTGAADADAYQQSLGAALSARDALTAGEEALRRQDARAYDEALAEINRLIELWPGAEPPEHPAAYNEVLRQTSRVRLALSPFL